MRARIGHEGVDTGSYDRGDQVRVRVPGDSHSGQTGTVRRVYNDGGEMVHVVRFADGATDSYEFSDIVSKQQGSQHD